MEAFWAQIAENATADHRSVLLAYPRIGRVPRAVQDAKIPLIEKAVRASGFAATKSNARLIRQNRVDSIYLTDWPALSLQYLVWRLLGVRRIVLHDHTSGDRVRAGSLSRKIKRVLHALRIFSPTLCVGVADHVRQKHIERGADPNRCVTVTNGIAPFDIRDSRAATRQAIGVPEDAIIFASTGRATRLKGLDFAVRVIAALSNVNDKIHFVHCGEGPDLERFRQLAVECGVAGRVHFLGRRNDVYDILSASDGAFHPSLTEAMSLAILEYMCAGLPVVVPDIPSVRLAIEDGQTGIVYPRGDIDGAAKALARLASEREQRQILGGAARRSCIEKYSLAVTRRQFAERVLPQL